MTIIDDISNGTILKASIPGQIERLRAKMNSGLVGRLSLLACKTARPNSAGAIAGFRMGVMLTKRSLKPRAR